ncbi:conserved hypothetical protein [Gammaproteobacteria bacterium]
MHPKQPLISEIVQILSLWKTNFSQQELLLGLPPGSLFGNREEIALPDESTTQARAELLLAVDFSICLSFPHAPEVARLWVHTANPFFEERTPLEVMLSEGLPGIVSVHSSLNGLENW